MVYFCSPQRMSSAHLEIGKRGEEAAAEYLILHGYKILGRNIKTKRGEIDIIARAGDTIVFVEVKANKRVHDAFTPSVRVGFRKMERLQNAGELWLESQNSLGCDLSGRIDVIEVCEGKVIEHFEDVAS